MGFFWRTQQRLRVTELEQSWNMVSGSWDYILRGLIVANRIKLETTIPLGNWLKELNECWVMSPFVKEPAAEQFAAQYDLPAFRDHTGVGYTCDELFQLLNNTLIQMAGYTQEELTNSVKTEMAIDRINAASGADDFIEMIHPNTHTQKPPKNTPFKVKLETPIMIGDILNLLGYHYNKIANSKNPTAKKLYEAMINEIAQDGNFTKGEKAHIISVIEDGLRDMDIIANK